MHHTSTPECLRGRGIAEVHTQLPCYPYIQNRWTSLHCHFQLPHEFFRIYLSHFAGTKARSSDYTTMPAAINCSIFPYLNHILRVCVYKSYFPTPLLHNFYLFSCALAISPLLSPSTRIQRLLAHNAGRLRVLQESWLQGDPVVHLYQRHLSHPPSRALLSGV